MVEDQQLGHPGSVCRTPNADRLLLDEVRLRPLDSRTRVLGPGADEPVPWEGAMFESALGPCPRAEVVHEEGDQVLRGRRLRVLITCIAAPASGCRGTALLGRRGRYGRGAFAVAAGRRRTIEVRVTDRGVRLVRRMRERFHEGPLLKLSARVRDGRAHGTDYVVIDRVR